MKEPGLFKISGGRLIKISSQKVPRVIGKQGSMVSLIKSKTGCEITVGQNGLVWLKGTPEGELLAEKAVKMIEEKSHLEGLTEKMDKFLDENRGSLPPAPHHSTSVSPAAPTESNENNNFNQNNNESNTY